MIIKSLLLISLILVGLIPALAHRPQHPQQPPPPQKNSMGFEEEQDVIVLRHTNMDKALRTYSHLLVVFHAPWCQPCKAYMPDFIRAANVLKQQGSKTALGKIDGTLEKELTERYDIKSYPTMKFFLNGKMTNYTAGRTETEIINWVAKTTMVPCKLVENMAQLERFVYANEVVVMFWGDSETEGFKTYETVSREIPELPYVYTTSNELRAMHRVPQNVQVSLLRAFEEPIVHFIEDLNAVNLKNFIKANRYPLIMLFNTQHTKRIFGEKNPLLLLITGTEKSENDQAWETFVAAAHELKGKIIMGTVPKETEWGHRMLDFLGASQKLPLISIVKPFEYRTEKYVYKGNMTKDEIVKFYENFKEKRIAPSYRSSLPPKNATGPVTVVVGKTFKEIVNDKQKDVLLFLYAPWCRNSQATLPELEALARHVSSIENLVIAKMDASVNEIEGVHVPHVPYILFFAANNKTRPTLFKGERTVQGFWTWLETRLTVDYDKSLIPEISAESIANQNLARQSGWDNTNRGPVDLHIPQGTPASPMMPSLGLPEAPREGPQGVPSVQTVTVPNEIRIPEPEADTSSSNEKLGGDDL